MTRYFLLALIGCLLVSGMALGEVGASWLEIGPGGRAAALGEAVTATVQGPTATYWNPAAVGKDGSGLEVMYVDWIKGTSSQYVSGEMQAGKWGLGGSILHVGTSNMELRDNPSASPIGTFDARSYAIGLSASREMFYGIRMGVTARYLSDAIYIYDTHGWAFDAGLLKAGLFEGRLDLAATARHMGSMDAMISEAYDLPTTYSAGAAWHVGTFGMVAPTIMVDAVQVLDQDLSVRGALELEIGNMVALRGGYATGYEARDLSFGFGLHWRAWKFDYGYSPFDYDLGNTQRLSLSFLW